MITQVIRYHLICLFFISTFSFSKTPIQNAFLEGGFESANAFINFIVLNSKRYIVKQKKDCEKTVVSVMRDALASYIAKNLGVAHFVKIISAEEEFPGKIYQNCPATLLTVAAGKVIRQLDKNHKYFRLSLQQRSVKDVTRKELDTWLDEEVIFHMTWHKQLPIIVALDLFICNSDRHRGNLFYDDETDSFCAIDMDNIYRRNLPDFACKNL